MPDYGDTANARSWSNANVYIAFKDAITGLFPSGPADIDAAMPAGWDLVGLLDGNQGFTEATTETVTDTFAWGDILVASRVSDQKTTKTFTTFETNDTTDRLQHIESGVQYRKPAEQVKICFETLDASKTVTERRISHNVAEVRVNGDLTENATAPKTIPFIATIFPGSSLELWTIQRTADDSSSS